MKKYPHQVCYKCGVSAQIINEYIIHKQVPSYIINELNTSTKNGICDCCGGKDRIYDVGYFDYPDFSIFLKKSFFERIKDTLKRRYRIVPDKYQGYCAEVSFWYLPFVWLELSTNYRYETLGSNSYNTLSEAEELIDRHRYFDKKSSKVYFKS